MVLPPLPDFPQDLTRPPAPGWEWRGAPGSSPGDPQSIEWLSIHWHALSHAQEEILVLQDVWGARPGDAHLPPEVFYDDEAVYYIVHSGAAPVGTAARRIRSFLLIGFFVREALPGVYAAGQRHLDKATVRDFVARTDEILVSAYDREGFVLWRRSSRKKKAAEPIGFAA